MIVKFYRHFYEGFIPCIGDHVLLQVLPGAQQLKMAIRFNPPGKKSIAITFYNSIEHPLYTRIELMITIVANNTHTQIPNCFDCQQLIMRHVRIPVNLHYKGSILTHDVREYINRVERPDLRMKTIQKYHKMNVRF